MPTKITAASKAADKKAAKPKKTTPKKVEAPKELTAEQHIEKAIELIEKQKIYSRGSSTTQVVHSLNRGLQKLIRLKQMVG